MYQWNDILIIYINILKRYGILYNIATFPIFFPMSIMIFPNLSNNEKS